MVGGDDKGNLGVGLKFLDHGAGVGESAVGIAHQNITTVGSGLQHCEFLVGVCG